MRGFGAPDVKSALLFPASKQPPLPLETLNEFEGAGVGPAPSKQFAVEPNPTKSITVTVGHVPVRATFEFESATFPAVPDIAIDPEISGVGRATPAPAPTAKAIRKYPPAGIVALNDWTVQDEPVAEAY